VAAKERTRRNELRLHGDVAFLERANCTCFDTTTAPFLESSDQSFGFLLTDLLEDF
jgi:hypothetical protein